jgi:hypothetical protein
VDGQADWLVKSKTAPPAVCHTIGGAVQFVHFTFIFWFDILMVQNKPIPGKEQYG